MKVVKIYEHGSIDKLIYEDIDEPILQDNQIKVRVKAASINHLDIWVRKGLPNVKFKLPIILGCDASGKVVESKNNNFNFLMMKEIL